MSNPQMRFYGGLQRRGVAQDDPVAAAAIDGRLRSGLAELLTTSASTIDSAPLESTPPRRVAAAMALAVFSQPHLVNTFKIGSARDGLVCSNEVLEVALGLSGWELDDLREEVDRRAGGVLKQGTLVRWLEGRHRDQLFPLLLPGIELANPQLHSEGGHLYVLADLPDTPTGSLFLPWLRSEQAPRFRGRYTDSRIKTGMARSIGVPELEAPALLERSILVVPRARFEARLAHDAWRRSGTAAVANLGASYTGWEWLTRSVEPSDVRWRDWVPDEGSQDPHDSMGAFDALVKIRVHHTLQALYTEIMAGGGAQSEEALDLYDLSSHLSTVLRPLLAWTRNKGSATWLAEIVKQDPESTRLLLDKLHATWSERMAYWTAPPADELSGSPFGKWLTSVAAFDSVYTDIRDRRADLRFGHEDVLPLFTAHFIHETPMPRGLMTPASDASSPGAALAKWFWPTWVRLLDTIEDHAARTDPEFVVPEGMF